MSNGLPQWRPGQDSCLGEAPHRDGGGPGLPDRGLSLQAVEELLESLDLEKSSCCLGLSRVSERSLKEGGWARPALSGRPHPNGWPSPPAANSTSLPLNNRLVQSPEHPCDVRRGSGLEGGTELGLNPGVGSGEDRREESWTKQEGSRQSTPEAPHPRAARAPEEQAGRGEAMLPPPAHKPNSSPEWNVVSERQARPGPGAGLPRHSMPEGQASVPPTGRSPACLSLLRLGGLTGGVHVCAPRAMVGGRAFGSQRGGSEPLHLSAGREGAPCAGASWAV